MRRLLLIILMCLPIISFGQGKVTRQETNTTSSQSTSSTQNTKPSSSSKKSTIPPIKITLATEIDGQRKYFSTTEWKNLGLMDILSDEISAMS